jgi:hypothetical protein
VCAALHFSDSVGIEVRLVAGMRKERRTVSCLFVALIFWDIANLHNF